MARSVSSKAAPQFGLPAIRLCCTVMPESVRAFSAVGVCDNVFLHVRMERNG